MKRFKKAKVNWKYIIGEVLLIFVGISLAIWFNNWNTERKTNREKEVAIQKIEGEVQNNLEELLDTRENNSRIRDAIDTYKSLYVKDVGTVASKSQMVEFHQKYPGFFIVEDSTLYKEDTFVYEGNTFINLGLPELTKIAWETSKVTGITSAFGYECLYQLEGMYIVQKLVENEFTKAALALQDGEIDKLFRILSFIDQLDQQLEDDCREILKNIRNCK